MSKAETTEEELYRFVKNCRKALDRLFNLVANKPAAYKHLRAALNAVEDLALTVIEEEGGKR